MSQPTMVATRRLAPPPEAWRRSRRALRASGSATVAVWYAAFDWLGRECDATDCGWLSEAEFLEMQKYRNESRREAWLFGRFLAKRLVREQFPGILPEETSIEILSRDKSGRSVRPTVTVEGQPLAGRLSLSHSDRGVLVALSPDSEVSVGVDLVALESIPFSRRPEGDGASPLGAAAKRGDVGADEIRTADRGFLETWFTSEERADIGESDPHDVATRWAVKEAAYKACNRGEPFAPRNVEVFRSPSGSYRVRYNGIELDERADVGIREVDGHVAIALIVGEGTWPRDVKVEWNDSFAATVRSASAVPAPPSLSRWFS